ncbi:MAG: UDP-N-acetylmuramoyl-L-alanyl-D-glutamate--2,6-diaminopimelate ligase [Alphaproteobacteria bacterium]
MEFDFKKMDLFKGKKIVGESIRNIKGIATHTDQIQAGFIFVAIRGDRVNGENYIPQAIQKGAQVIVLSDEANISESEGITFIYSQTPRRDLALLAKEFYQKRPSILMAVTGTNGKSSTVEYVRQFFEQCGKSVASLGTIGLQSQQSKKDSNLTTPDAVTFYKTLFELEKEKVEAVCFEASSIGIDQERIAGLEGELNAVGFTNLTPDHLVYHKTMEKYFEAKAQVFSEYISPKGVSVLNADDDATFEKLKAISNSSYILSYGKKGENFQILKNVPTQDGQNLTLGIWGRPLKIKFPLIGEFQIYNALCALGLFFGGLYGKKIFEESFWQPYRYAQVRLFLQELKFVRGRLEFVKKTERGASVFVDYAHTADGLETVLKALRPHVIGKLTVVFGMGGGRQERATLGKVANEFADKIYLTDDNPREDDPMLLRNLIKKYITQTEKLTEIADRKKAIETALSESKEGDIIIVAGKGHETYQEIKGVKHHFDDREVILKSISKKY